PPVAHLERGWGQVGQEGIDREASRVESDMRSNLPDRFWSKVEIDPFGCWRWRAATTEGYGRFKLNGRTLLAHRVLYEATYGPVAGDFQLEHLCRVRRCVRPDHLEPVTQAENIRRGMAGWRERDKTHCLAGHPFDETNTMIRFRGGRPVRECRECRRRRKREHYERKTSAGKTGGSGRLHRASRIGSRAR